MSWSIAVEDQGVLLTGGADGITVDAISPSSGGQLTY